MGADGMVVMVDNVQSVPSENEGTDLTDFHLIALIQQGNEWALETLYDRYRGLLFSLALRTVQIPGDAEDILQESFLNVWRSAATYRPERSSPRSWLISIVHHRCIDRLRSRRSKPAGVALEEGMHVPDATDVWSEVAAQLTGESVRRALDHLPADQRGPIELAYFSGYTQTQIAEMLSVPLGTIKSRIRSGLFKLRDLMAVPQSATGLDRHAV